MTIFHGLKSSFRLKQDVFMQQMAAAFLYTASEHQFSCQADSHLES